jgi:Transposase
MRVGPPHNEQPARLPGTDGALILPARSRQVNQQLFAGIDWATKTHAVCVVAADGSVRARFEVANTGKTFAGLVRRLVKLAVAAVAIERPDGPLVEGMLDAGLRVVVITPRQVKALRSRYGAAGAKSDPGDAYVLADALRTDGHRLAVLTPDRTRPRCCGRLAAPARTWSRPGWRCATSSAPSWNAAFPARSVVRPPRLQGGDRVPAPLSNRGRSR